MTSSDVDLKMTHAFVTSHCIPEEPPTSAADTEPFFTNLTAPSITPTMNSTTNSPRSSAPSLSFSDATNDVDEDLSYELPAHSGRTRQRRASTVLISKNAQDIKRLLGEEGTGAELIETCCGGGCCMNIPKDDWKGFFDEISLPDNAAFRGLGLNSLINAGVFAKTLLIPNKLTGVVELPTRTVSIGLVKRNSTVSSPTDSAVSISSNGIDNTKAEDKIKAATTNTTVDFTTIIQDNLPLESEVDTAVQPPNFVQPHAPYNVFPAKIFSARELTKPGAEKRTWHFDLDVTDYPAESGVDFRVGGAIGVLAPNSSEMVEEFLDLLASPRYLRDRSVLLKTTSGRWPTVWGEDQARELLTTRRALVTWCTDIQSYPPTKPLLRLLGLHATDPSEAKVLEFLVSSEGQGLFCDLRTGPHITVPQLLHAFPSSKPPLDALLSVLTQLMPRFYSLSNDPIEQCPGERKIGCTRLIEIAVTVHETCSWETPGAKRTGLGSGFFERQAQAFVAAEARGEKPDIRIPMFKGLMANPLAKEFVADGPMLLVGAGVGVAPFRGFVQRRLKNANCANKVWVLQGIRDSLVDELYAGEWGVHEDEVKKVVQSRSNVGGSRYVQDEVRREADLVWWIINQLEGRIYVCGSSKGMGEGVQRALKDVAMNKGNMSNEEAAEFWKVKGESGQYVAETW